MVGNDENILVEFDYQNIIIVDPNKVVDSEGRVKDRNIKHENLVYYASLECQVLPRTRLAVGTNNLTEVQNVTISKVNFLSPPGQEYLKNEYYDEFTGEKNIQGEIKYNQQTVNAVKVDNNSSEYYLNQTTQNNYDTGLLGMKSINISVNEAGFTEVSVELEDVRGRALFEKGEESPYAVFFNLPYPVFYLTVKGYLGQAIKYQLSLLTFNAEFDTGSGNFRISLKFNAYKYNVLTSVNIAHLLATPYMYNVNYSVEQNSVTPVAPQQTNNATNTVQQISTSKGFGKIREVYSEYKSKNLVDQDLPELTLRQLTVRLESLEKFILNSYGKEELGPVTDQTNYKKDLEDYNGDVYYFGQSWFNRYSSKKSGYVEKSTGKVIYTFNKEIVESNSQDKALSELNSLIENYNKKLKTNITFGENGTYNVSGQPFKSNIDVNITTNDIIYNVNPEDIDFKESYVFQNGKQPTPEELSTFSSTSITTVFNSVSQTNGRIEYTWFSFDGQNRFLEKTSQIANTLDKLSEEIDEKISEALSRQLQTQDNGLGFRPTIRNICGILMANAEAFLRLMNDVHKNAWDVRNNRERRNAVLGQTTNTNPDDVPGNEIYPWPQYFVETNSDKGEKFELRYPGDPKVINKTKAYLNELWPEVQFVEEYLRGLTQTTQTNVELGPVASDVGVTNRVSLNAIDYFTSNRIYANQEEVKFFYEIYERFYLAPYYQKFNKKFVLDSQVSQVVSESETISAKNALGISSPYLISKIKQYGLGAQGYKGFLESISNNGTGESWQKFIRGEFVTSYIAQEVEKNFELFFPSVNVGLKSVQPEATNIDKLKTFLESSKTNETDITDTFPFTIPNWYKTGLADGKSSNQKDIYNTTKVLKYNTNFKMISNFTEQNDVKSVRPITSFNFYSVTKPTINQATVELKNFYKQRKIEDLLPTEGYVYYNDYFGDNEPVQTTSIFNTPYFHNAISEAVLGLKTNSNTPFVQAAYLFLNSLPLATLREKYKTYKGTNLVDDLDYIFATLKKFGAIHKVPYAWILKYGSIWHRYKKYNETGVDILDNVWTNFDYTYFYDPITQNPSKQYTITANSLNQNIVLQNITPVGSNTLMELNLGFYPLLINNYYYVFNNKDLFTLFNDQELNNNLGSGYTLNICTDAVINKNAGYDNSQPNQSLKITPWVVTLSGGKYVAPCFGSNINQLELELFKGSGTTPFSNSSVYDGSIRGFLSLPHYGFFDNNQLDRPAPNKYIKNIFSGQSKQESISFNKQSGYVNIEEILGVFNKPIMDLFENEFLKFCKSMFDYNENYSNTEAASNINSNKISTDPSPSFKNFQMLLIQMFKITPVPFTNSKDFINKVSEAQFTQIVNTIQKFLEFDVTFKYGNPSDFNRRVYDSFSTSNTIVDGVSFGPYNQNTLPGDGVTVAQSQQIYPESWKTLKNYIGETTIPKLAYTDAGSTITDFFIDNNIEFSPQSIVTLSSLIKTYATQKAIQQSYNPNTLVQDVTSYLQNGENILNQSLNSFLNSLRKELPNVTETPEGFTRSAVNGTQSKLELWETFKSFNDTWIAGTDYSQTLLFEDLLFLDRGNRDVGDLILVDPFKVKTLLSNINISASTYGYLNSILTSHHFVTMILPSYVNFYNVIDGTDGTQAYVDSTNEFGNNMFGTFLNVDTRKSSPKMVAKFSEPGSKYLANDQTKNPNFRFKSDAFDIVKAADCPIVDKLDGKTDWTKSNRVVGFNVDIGVRNQNVFKDFKVSQELGKQTTESLAAQNNMINQSSGRNVTTQNVTLYNFYKNRSYQCSVSCLGNAMIQPTMYFNLRYVPMFYGPYMITSVKHQINPAGFSTNFEGIRQSVLALPKITDYMQSISKEILQSLRDTKKRADRNATKSAETTNNISQVSEGYNSNTQELSQGPTSCLDTSTGSYQSFTKLDGKSPESNGQNNVEVSLSVNDFKTKLTDIVGGVVKLEIYIFVLSYLESYNGTQFKTYNNNFAGVGLNNVYPPALINTYFEKVYSCQNQSDGTSKPYASFKENNFFNFMKDYLDKKINDYDESAESIAKFYFEKWIQNSATQQSFDTFKESQEYQGLLSEITEGLNVFLGG